MDTNKIYFLVLFQKYFCNILIFKFIIIVSLLLSCILISNAQSKIEINSVQEYYDSARYYNRIGDYNYAIQLLQTLINQKKLINEDNPPEYFKIYNQLGVIYRKKGNLEKALENYKKSLMNTTKDFNQAVIYGNIANIYSFKGDYLKAIDFLENALISLQRSSHKNKNIRIAENFNNQGYANYSLGKYSLAKEKYLQSILIREEFNLAGVGKVYYNCGLAYAKLDSLDKAVEYFVKANEINTKVYGQKHLITQQSNMNLANFYANRQKFRQAQKIYATVYDQLIKLVGDKHPYISIYYKDLGFMYQKMGNYQQALNCYQRALISKIPDFNDTVYYINPSTETLPDMDLIEILKDKAYALVELSETKSKEEYLKTALVTLELTVNFIEQLRTGYLYENSKLLLIEKEHETYLLIIQIAHQLLNITNNKNYIDIAFKYSERSKYAVLKESINEEIARKHVSIPDSIRIKEHHIKEQIGTIRLQLTNENKRLQPDSTKQLELKEQLFHLNQEQEHIITELELNHPEYFNKKYENNTVNIANLQSVLTEKEAIISYTLTDTILFIFLITSDYCDFKRIGIDSTFYKNLDSYSNFLRGRYLTPYDWFRVPSYELYQKLIIPIQNHLKGKNLLIIPDSKLSLVSFETLTTEPYIEREDADYRKEPYLLNQYPIGYSYSATLFANTKNRTKQWNPRFLGFAPDYENSRDSLEFFPTISASLKKMSLLMRKRIYTKEKATEHNLKKHIEKYGIVHIYAHGTDNILNPELSKIYLSYKNDTIEDGYLYGYEVDELDLNAELVVLASCFSGSGTINKGEGVLSIGRNFINSGTHSIISSLWIANYGSTLFEMKIFYRQLLIGKRKDEAMRHAKLKYIESSQFLGSHPKNWASLVVTGNQDSIFKAYLVKIAIIFVVLLVSLIVVAIKLKKGYSRKR